MNCFKRSILALALAITTPFATAGIEPFAVRLDNDNGLSYTPPAGKVFVIQHVFARQVNVPANHVFYLKNPAGVRIPYAPLRDTNTSTQPGSFMTEMLNPVLVPSGWTLEINSLTFNTDVFNYSFFGVLADESDLYVQNTAPPAIEPIRVAEVDANNVEVETQSQSARPTVTKVEVSTDLENWEEGEATVTNEGNGKQKFLLAKNGEDKQFFRFQTVKVRGFSLFGN